MNPYVSWAIVLVVTGGLGYYYSNTGKSRGRTPIRAVAEKAEPAATAPKQKKPKPRKSPEPAKKLPADEKQPAATSTATPPVYTADEEEDVDTRDFAKRLAAARSGVAVGDGKAKPRKEKRSKAVPAAAAPVESAASSNGADADDDLSSTDNVVVSSTDVSDMLEKPAPSASVLRLTGSVESNEKKPKQQQAFKPVETKKQRQNRQKNEARKQINQEAEAERRKLLEKQLHTARELERQEAARHKPAAPQNAWTSASETNGAKAVPATLAATPASNGALLDTFEPAAPASSSKPAGTWTNNLPPEEEQMRILGVSQADEDWTTVPSKKEKTKKKAKADESANEGSASEVTESKPVEVVATAPVAQIPIPRGKNHPLDSDWAA